MNCGMSMVKYILFIFNLLCALCGILIIILGGLLFSNVHSFSDLKSQSSTLTVPIALVVLGAAIFIIAFFGCYGAIRESECMSMTYATFLFILLILDIALVALVFTTKDSQKEISSTIVKEAWNEYKINQKSNIIHVIEAGWECCGEKGPSDYVVTGNKLIDRACCPGKPKAEESCPMQKAYKTGCVQAFTDWVLKYANIIAYAGLGIMAVELVGFIFACCLANHIRNHRRRSTY